MADFGFTLPTNPQLAKLKQQQALAELLMKQGAQQDDPYKMAGGLVVPQSPLAGLAKAGQQLSGAYIANQAENKDKEYAKDFSQKLAAAIADPQIQTGIPAIANAPGPNMDGSAGWSRTAVSPGMDALASILKSGDNADNPYAKQYADALQLKSVENKGDLENKVAYETDPRVLAAKQKIAAAGATRISMGAQEKEEDKTVGKGFGEDYLNIQKAGRESSGKIAKYDRLDQLLHGVETGTFKGTTTQLKAAAKGAGLDLESMGITDDVAPVQAAQALTNAMALELRNPSGGAGMPGALSDADRVYLTSMTPGIEKTSEGRKLMADTAKSLAKRDAEVAQLARNYRQKNGRLDEGFYDVLAQYSDVNPLFKGAPNSATPQTPSSRPPLSTFMK